MRQLHPVSFHEKFVASGTYTLYSGDLPTGDIEYWTMHQPGEGLYTIRADRDGRFGSGASWLFEGLYRFDGSRWQVERFDVATFGADNGQELLTRYFFEETQAIVSVRAGAETEETRTVELPGGYAVMPPAYIASFLFVPRGTDGGRREALVFLPALPALSVDAKDDGWLRRLVVDALGPGEHTVGARAFPVVGYRLRETETDNTFRCWFDEQDTLLRCESGDGDRALLTEYVHRPERSS